MLRPANSISDVLGGALPVESISLTVRTNGHGTKTGVPPRKAAGRRGPYQIHSGNGRWARQRGVGRLNPCAQESKARTGRFLREKLISDYGLFSFYKGQ